MRNHRMLLCMLLLAMMTFVTGCQLINGGVSVHKMAGQWLIGDEEYGWYITVTANDARSGHVTLYVGTGMTGKSLVADFDIETCDGGIYRVPNKDRVMSVSFSGNQMTLSPGFTGNSEETWTKR